MSLAIDGFAVSDPNDWRSIRPVTLPALRSLRLKHSAKGNQVEVQLRCFYHTINAPLLENPSLDLFGDEDIRFLAELGLTAPPKFPVLRMLKLTRCSFRRQLAFLQCR